jgi:uncharacterized protein YndB with AHSA1/START domain
MTVADELVVERRVAAPPSAVFAYLTDGDRWARWQGASADIDARPDGLFRVTMADGSAAEGRFIEVVADTRVVFTWGWRGSPTLPPGSSTVEIHLVPDGDGTLVRLTHRGLPALDRPIHLIGWQHYVARLATAGAGGDPGPDFQPG